MEQRKTVVDPANAEQLFGAEALQFEPIGHRRFVGSGTVHVRRLYALSAARKRVGELSTQPLLCPAGFQRQPIPLRRAVEGQGRRCFFAGDDAVTGRRVRFSGLMKMRGDERRLGGLFALQRARQRKMPRLATFGRHRRHHPIPNAIVIQLHLPRPAGVADANEAFNDQMRELGVAVTRKADRGVGGAARNGLARDGDHLEQLPDVQRQSGELLPHDLADGRESRAPGLELPMTGELIDEKWAAFRLLRDDFGALVGLQARLADQTDGQCLRLRSGQRSKGDFMLVKLGRCREQGTPALKKRTRLDIITSVTGNEQPARWRRRDEQPLQERGAVEIPPLHVVDGNHDHASFGQA